jgi:hypothetical protein
MRSVRSSVWLLLMLLVVSLATVRPALACPL